MWIEILRAACVGSATQYHARGSGGRGAQGTAAQEREQQCKDLEQKDIGLERPGTLVDQVLPQIVQEQ